MLTLITVIHIIVCLLLAGIVLLQHGKGADIGASFGGASQTVFGARGATTILQKMTAGAAVTFMLTSLALAYLSARTTNRSVMTEKVPVAATPAPVQTPVAGTPAPAVSPTAASKPSKSQ